MPYVLTKLQLYPHYISYGFKTDTSLGAPLVLYASVFSAFVIVPVNPGFNIEPTLSSMNTYLLLKYKPAFVHILLSYTTLRSSHEHSFQQIVNERV
ncbi:hypothetical protein RO3G_10127 [Rhizopus delemar RA 99-880]|uniref:Uncharacterized protein n=1 Tax=Rhizopus delemar (strain RA 99-880 / ATCC MYA-4621 / FGSC 9543 / NRRL 43880) TaxID=246409 RepID=I1CAD7_RHIO9|nr:hypothetical protein RO3G_10127 [Rhizopus delemar RA 99-880]|eukprot:EIE85417.1 hypothetical protein RO3G_10127 [Rhizopus delemar RA 99-880]